MTITSELIDKIKTELDTLEARLAVDDECMKNLVALSSLIWIESYYEPTTPETQKFAQTLYPHIKALNDKLHFKR